MMKLKLGTFTLLTATLALFVTSCGQNAHVADPRKAAPAPAAVAPEQPTVPTTVQETPKSTPIIIPTTTVETPPVTQMCWDRDDNKCIRLYRGHGLTNLPPDARVGDLYINVDSPLKCVYEKIRERTWTYFASMQGRKGAAGKDGANGVSQNASAIPPFYCRDNAAAGEACSGDFVPAASEGQVGQGWIQSSEKYVYIKGKTGWKKAVDLNAPVSTPQSITKSYECVVAQAGEQPNATLADQAGRLCMNVGDGTLWFANRPNNWIRFQGDGKAAPADGNYIGKVYDKLPDAKKTTANSTVTLIDRSQCEESNHQLVNGKWTEIGARDFWVGNPDDEKGRRCAERLASLFKQKEPSTPGTVVAASNGTNGNDGRSFVGVYDGNPDKKGLVAGSTYLKRNESSCRLEEMRLKSNGKWEQVGDAGFLASESCVKKMIPKAKNGTNGTNGTNGVNGNDGIAGASFLGIFPKNPGGKRVAGDNYLRSNKDLCELTQMVYNGKDWDDKGYAGYLATEACIKKLIPAPLNGISSLGIRTSMPATGYAKDSTFLMQDSVNCTLTQYILGDNGWAIEGGVAPGFLGTEECLAKVAARMPKQEFVQAKFLGFLSKQPDGQFINGTFFVLKDENKCEQVGVEMVDGKWFSFGETAPLITKDGKCSLNFPRHLGQLDSEPSRDDLANGSTYELALTGDCSLQGYILDKGKWKKQGEKQVLPTPACIDQRVNQIVDDKIAKIPVSTPRAYEFIMISSEFGKLKSENRFIVGDQVCVYQNKDSCWCAVLDLTDNGWISRESFKTIRRADAPQDKCEQTEVKIVDEAPITVVAPTPITVVPPTTVACAPAQVTFNAVELNKATIDGLMDKLPYRSTSTHKLGSLTVRERSRMASILEGKKKKSTQVEIVENTQVVSKFSIRGLPGEAEIASRGLDLANLSVQIKLETRKFFDYVGDKSDNQTDTEILCLLGDEKAEDGRCSGTLLTKGNNGSKSDWSGNVKPWAAASLKNSLFSDEIKVEMIKKSIQPRRKQASNDDYVDVAFDKSLMEVFGLSRDEVIQRLYQNASGEGERDLFFVVADDNFLKSATLTVTIPCLAVQP